MFPLTIIQLPEELANKIAAGEVVERPASVVKELIENSIDANSTWIQIELEEAGMNKIKVIDNGDGMSTKDSERAFMRHATSKISTDADLFRMSTLGFRGEALASIASVSRLTLKTSQGTEAGIELALEGGNIIAKSKSDARKGTEITVRDLFYNTPARLKYMKSIHTELGHISDIINRTALAHPNVRFDVTHNGKHLFRTAGSGDVLQVISQVYNTQVAKQMMPIHVETLDFKIEGFIAKPEETRANRSYITTIINGRYIRHHGLNHAILRGYHTLLPIRRFPIVVLHIKMDPILVDVNVHPTKLEVRFSKEQELLDEIEAGIKQVFRKTLLIPEVKHPQKGQSQSTVEQNKLDLTIESGQDKSIFTNETIFEPKEKEVFERKSMEQSHRSIEKTTATENITTNEKAKTKIPMMEPVGQIQGTYIVAQNEKGMYLIDQHAAQERIKYERFKKAFGHVDSKLQELLIPITFDFSRQEAIIIKENREKLLNVGIDLQPFGSQSFIVRSHPTWFPKGFEEESIKEIVHQVIEEKEINISELREEAAILMACKRSLKANHYLTKEEMTYLLNDLRKTNQPFTCPHGRPIIIHFSSYELEKMFKRVM